ncbi:MAG: DNA/RNA non-specific endonuclease [Gammaproteobacteria bacterium]
MFRKLAWSCVFAAIAVVCALASPIVSADYLRVHRTAWLKATPNVQATGIDRLEPGTLLQLLGAGKQKNGYYQAHLTDGRQGWIYRSLVRRYRESGTLRNEFAVAPDVVTRAGESGFDGHRCAEHLLFGVPRRSDQVLCRLGYALGYSYGSKIPEWVAYYITKDSVHGANVPRLDNFTEDISIPATARSREIDYSESGYDRGHMAPSAAIDFSRTANDQTFLYSNMTPQRPGFNRNVFGYTGAWGALEDRVRDWVRDRGALYVIAGPIMGGTPTSIGDGVAVAPAFFKVIVDPARLDTIAFILPHEDNTASKMEEFVRSIDEVEAATGLELLSKVRMDIQPIIESVRTEMTQFSSE